jgi:hypothetical protein
MGMIFSVQKLDDKDRCTVISHFVLCSEQKPKTNRTITVRFSSSRSEPNSNQFFRNRVEPNRTRTGFRKMKSNRTELESVKPGSIRSLDHITIAYWAVTPPIQYLICREFNDRMMSFSFAVSRLSWYTNKIVIISGQLNCVIYYSS